MIDLTALVQEIGDALEAPEAPEDFPHFPNLNVEWESQLSDKSSISHISRISHTFEQRTEPGTDQIGSGMGSRHQTESQSGRAREVSSEVREKWETWENPCSVRALSFPPLEEKMGKVGNPAPAGAPSGASFDAEDWQAAFDERAGILEFDEGLPRAEAERLACEQIFGSTG